MKRAGFWLRCCLLGVLSGSAAAAPPVSDSPSFWTRASAINWALTHNPELATVRRQRGVAEAGIIIARTYPFNPTFDSDITQNSGPESAGITNEVGHADVVLFQIELHHQGRYRRQNAEATLARTDWEIAGQELAVAIRAARAFDAVLYRRAKLVVLEDAVALRERVAAQVEKQVKGKRVDLLLAQVDTAETRGQLVAARAALTVARSDLARVLGIVCETPAVEGALEVPSPPCRTEELIGLALATRPIIHAHEAAVAEAEARWRLEIANRNGNPSVGPHYEYDPTRTNFAGVHLAVPLPIFNRHKGEICQREAEKVMALQGLLQVQTQVRQEVEAAVARLEAGLAWETELRTDLLPEIQRDVAEAERLAAEDKTKDSAELTELRSRQLKARDNYLDSLWEVSQARADLAAALGDPGVMLGSLTGDPCAAPASAPHQ